MDYFSWFEMPVSPSLDEAKLRRAFLAKSRELHPDFYTLEGEETQAEILKLSTLNNEAYKTLKDFDSRLKYLLEQKNLLNQGEDKLPMEFLMEMMELNTAIQELEFDFEEKNYQQLQGQINDFESTLEGSISPILATYDDATVSNDSLAALKNYYLKKKYLLRIKENMRNFANLK